MSQEGPLTLLRNARIFDGVHDELRDGHILIRGKTIERVIYDVAAPPPTADTTLDCEGKVVTPGFIDLHAHVMLCFGLSDFDRRSPWEVGVRGARNMEKMLQRGFTTIRDAGGCDGSMAEMVTSGLIAGPRVYPCCRMMSQSGGHFDFLPKHPGRGDCGCGCEMIQNLKDMAFIVDGPTAVFKASRMNLKFGATQLKIAVSGGAASADDPLHTVQFTPEEVAAAVKCANNWGTYVMAHCYTDAAARMCLDAGVRCLEHGHLLSDETVARCKELDVPVSTQFVVYKLMYSQAKAAGMDEAAVKKFEALNAKLYNIASLIKKHGVRTGFGTDIIGPEPLHEHQNMEFKLRQEAGWSNFEILRQATSESAGIIEMCGPLNRYGKLGVLEDGALADLLVHDQNPMEDVAVMMDASKQLRLIMRDGKVFKNTLVA